MRAYGYLRNNIVIQWSAPPEQSWNGPLFGYVVRYKLAMDPNAKLHYKTVYSHRITAEIITGLQTLAEYEISVAAYNPAGISEYSNISYVWTMESTPSAPPLAVTVSVKSSTSILVSWMPPSRQAVHGTIRGYVVRVYFRNGTQPRVEKQVLANLSTIYRRHQAYIYGLKKYTGYNIMVSGYTAKGEGPQSRPVSVRTLEDGK